MTNNRHAAVSASACVVDQFEAGDIGAPFKVILHDAVRVTTKGGRTVSYSIPNLDGLLRTIVISRILTPRKLSGAEIKFIRKVIGMKQKEMAQRIEVSAEHLSRCEAGSLVVSPTTEKLLRVFALKTALKLHKHKAYDSKIKLEDALDRLFDDMKPIAAFDVNDPLELHFHLRGTSSNANDDGDKTPENNVDWDSEQALVAA